MTIWYVDLGSTYTANVANTGVTSGSPLGGIAGIQRIVSGIAVGGSTFAAGDTIKVKAGAYNTILNLVKITTGSGSGLNVGDAVIETTTSGNTPVTGCTGTIVWVQTAGTSYWVESTGATLWTAGNYIYKVSDGSHAGSISAITYTGIQPAIPGNATNGRCKLIGVDVSWNELALGSYVEFVTNGSTRNDTAINCNALTANYWEIRKIKVSANGSTIAHFYINSYSYVYGCWADDSNNRGFRTGGNYNIFEQCLATYNVTGFYLNAYQILINCNANYSGADGYLIEGNTSVIGCLSYKNTYNGMNLDGTNNSVIYNCVINHNTQNGILIASGTNYTTNYIMGCRITRNGNGSASYYGINCTADRQNLENYNVFYANGSGTDHNTLNIVAGANSSAAGSSTDEGYTNESSNDFNLTSAAILRNTSITLPQ